VTGDHQHPTSGAAEWQQADQTGLTAADGDLLDRAVAAAGEVLDGGGVAASLRLA
jgi:hypothetical protein